MLIFLASEVKSNSSLKIFIFLSEVLFYGYISSRQISSGVVVVATGKAFSRC